MALTPGTRLGPYEILDAVGAGGMGEVYRAKDTRLDRTVAIKVLPTGSAGSPELRQRFEREAKAVSSLNHPHICTLYDVGHQDGTDYLVMEYIEGETLAARLEKGPLPPPEVLKYAVQMADALDKAHRQGLVHRDLKPGNIMVTKSGAKLLDFGLAKLAAPGDVVQGVTGVTRATPLTGEGTILGTLHYMPPEQLEGGEADARSDIFAFGCVLYEMATGRRAFEGKSQASLIAAIMEREPPPVSTISQVAPPALDRIISRCIAKDPDDRWQTARDLMHELQWLTSGSSQITAAVPAKASRRSRDRWTWWVAGFATLAVLGVEAYRFQAGPDQVPVLRASLLPPEDAYFRPDLGGHVAISPDGLTLAFSAIDSADGTPRLWVRPMQSSVALALPGTEGASYPFWSPDSRYLAFFSRGSLKKVQATGGPVLEICSAPAGRGGSWSPNGTIVFCPDFTEVLYRVPAAGGNSTVLTVRDSTKQDFTHRWPHFLPDGTHFLYFARTGGDEGGDSDAICLGSLEGGAPRRLFNAKSNVVYANGVLLFAHDDNLMAQPFDAGSLELQGDAVPITNELSYDPGLSRGHFAASQTGLLVYRAGKVRLGSHLVVYDRKGTVIDTIGESEENFSPRWSPDGKRLAVDIHDFSSNNTDIWIYDIERGIRTRFTFDAADDYSAVWSPDGTRLAFVSDRGGSSRIYLKNANGVGEEQFAGAELPVGRLDLYDWSDDGKFIVFVVWESGSASDIWILPLEGGDKPYPLYETEFVELWPAVSPDGRWIAYTSLESGLEEIYVTSFPRPSAKYQVSVSEGDRPLWRRDGKELFYTDNSDRLMVAQIAGSDAGFQIGSVVPLFEMRPKRPGSIYDVSADGERMVVNTRPAEGGLSILTLVANWPEELRER